MQLTGLTPLIQVFDMPTALRFYRDGLGFEIVSASPEAETPEGRFSHWVWLRKGGAELMLNTAHDAGERPAARDAGRERGHGDACLYIGCADLDATFADLAAKGLAAAPPTRAPYGSRRFAIRDPDGFELVFQEP